jgi:hypothetical protein
MSIQRILFIFLLLPSLNSWSQIPTLNGVVSDKETGEPISFAHIGIANSTIGTVSDVAGRFRINVSGDYQNAALIISHIGYKSKRLSVAELPENGIIYLTPDQTILDEIVIQPVDTVEEIIRRIIENIPNNYPAKDHIVKGFYRETERFVDSSFIYIAEATLELYKFDYGKRYAKSPVRMEKGINYSFMDDSIRRVRFYAGPHLAHDLDIIYTRDAFVSPMRIKKYTFTIYNVISYNNSEVLVIGFENNRGDYLGKIYVTTDTYAIIKAEMKYTESAYFLHLDGLWIDWTKGNKVVDYQRINNKWYLKNIYSADFGIDKVMNADVLATSQFVTTSIDTVNVDPFKDEGIIEYRDIFINKTGQYDTAFWGDENVLLPEKDLENYEIRTPPVKEDTAGENRSRFFDRVSFNVSPYYRPMNLMQHSASLQIEGVPYAIDREVADKDYSYGLYMNLRYNKPGLGFVGLDVYGSFPMQYQQVGISLGKTKQINVWRSKLLHGSIIELSTGFQGFNWQSTYVTFNTQSDLVLVGKMLDAGKIQVNYLMRGFEIPLSVGINIPINPMLYLSVSGGYNFSIGKNKHELKFSEMEGFILSRKSKKVSLSYNSVQLIIDDQVATALPYDMDNFYFRLGFSLGF